MVLENKLRIGEFLVNPGEIKLIQVERWYSPLFLAELQKLAALDNFVIDDILHKRDIGILTFLKGTVALFLAHLPVGNKTVAKSTVHHRHSKATRTKNSNNI